MKIKNTLLLIALLGTAGILILFSPTARQGALDGLALAESTIIPSLLPLLIIFLLIIKTNAGYTLASLLGAISVRLFRLPKITLPAIFLGLVGGYPTGAMLTRELFLNDEIDSEQAKRIMTFNFSGGCGFIITAVGAVLGSMRAGVILFTSVTLSSVIIGAVGALGAPRAGGELYSFRKETSIGEALTAAVSSAVGSVLAITAYITLFSAICGIVRLPDFLMPIIEITGGICSNPSMPLPLIGAFLSFGGLCIHLQIADLLSQMKVSYIRFAIGRIIGGALSYLITRLLLIAFPVELTVAYTGESSARLFSVNMGLSALLVLGCFVLVLDLNSRKKVV